MFLLWAVIIGVGVGYLRKGTIKNLASLELNGIWLIFLVLVIQILIFPLGTSEPIVSLFTQYLHLVSYLLLLAFVFLNRRYWQIIFMGIGMLMNLIVIMVNGGYMPASESALRKAGLTQVADKLINEGVAGNVILMGEGTKLNFLGDSFYTPKWLPLANAFSPGDLLLALGLIVLIQKEMS